ncbi:hypothetical protein EON67_07400 [archaeon]|nr:MAG: hypothetical protein EON67_07400 [archaeon]
MQRLAHRASCVMMACTEARGSRVQRARACGGTHRDARRQYGPFHVRARARRRTQPRRRYDDAPRTSPCACV